MKRNLLLTTVCILIVSGSVFSLDSEPKTKFTQDGEVKQEDMRNTVKKGYEEGRYLEKFRSDGRLNEVQRKFLNLLLDYIPKSGQVIDLGCGGGIPFDQYLVKEGLRVTGYDFVSKHIAAAKKNVPQAVYKEGDFTKFEYEDENVDGIIALYSIFHIPREEHEALFERMFSALKPGGVIMMNLGTVRTEKKASDFCGAKKMLWSNYTPEYYKRLFSKLTFNIIEEQFETFPGDKENHYWILIQKPKNKKQRVAVG